MTIKKNLNENELTIAPEGRLDTNTSPELEQSVKESIDGIGSLVFDLSGLSYISSAGLRVLLTAHKLMSKQGKMVIRNANGAIMDIFEVTGFVDILNIEA